MSVLIGLGCGVAFVGKGAIGGGDVLLTPHLVGVGVVVVVVVEWLE